MRRHIFCVKAGGCGVTPVYEQTSEQRGCYWCGNSELHQQGRPVCLPKDAFDFQDVQQELREVHGQNGCNLFKALVLWHHGGHRIQEVEN